MSKPKNSSNKKRSDNKFSGNNNNSSSFYRYIANKTPVKLWMTDVNGDCIFLNKNWYDYTGQQEDAALGFGWLEAIHPEEKKKIKKAYLLANTEIRSFNLEYRLRNTKGEYRWHQDLGEPLFEDDTFSGFIGAVIDIHERKIAEEALEAKEVQYKTYVEAMPQMAFIADAQGNVVYFNQRWYDYIKNKKDTEGWGWKDKNIHHPDDLQKTIDRWNYSLKTGKPYEIEYRLLRYDGEYRWHLGRAMPIRNAKGEITFWLGSNTDIHEQKSSEEELRKTNTELKNKNTSLEQLRKLRENLLHIISHDLKGPLGNMKLALDLYSSAKKEEVRQKLFDGLHMMVKKQQEVVNGLSEIISVQHPRELQAKKIKIEEVVKGILQEYQEKINAGDKISMDFSKAPVIKYVESFIYSILKNLITNAVKYQKTGRELRIEIDSKRVNDYVLVTVKDNGLGIDLKKHKKNIFHAFQRFTDLSTGSGIGLYIVKNLIEGNGGHIDIESEPDKGTTFYCYLKEY